MNTGKIEQQIDQEGYYISTTVGDSMYPMLRNRRDQVLIESVDCDLQRYDLPLYRRPSGEYVLHRILRVEKNTYIVCGDNRWSKERVPKNWIIGKMTGFYRDNIWVDHKNTKYRLYVHVWCDGFWIRVFLLRVKGLYRKLHKVMYGK